MKLLVAAPRGFCAGVDRAIGNCRKTTTNTENLYMYVMRLYTINML